MRVTQTMQRQQAQRKERELYEVRALAFKAAGVLLDQAISPAREIAILEKYVEDLQQVKADLTAKYPGYAGKPVGMIDVYIRRAVDHIADVRIGQVRPKGVR